MAEADSYHQGPGDEKLMIRPGLLSLSPDSHCQRETHHHHQPRICICGEPDVSARIFSLVCPVFVVSGVDGCLTLVCYDSSP